MIKCEPVFPSSHLEDVHYTSGYRGWRGRGQGRGENRGYNTGVDFEYD